MELSGCCVPGGAVSRGCVDVSSSHGLLVCVLILCCGCAGTFADRNGVFVGPDGHPVDRSGNRIGPAGTIVNDEGFIEAPDGTRYLPYGGEYPEEGSLPEGVTVGADGVPRGADGNPTGRRGTRALSTGEIVDPDGTLPPSPSKVCVVHKLERYHVDLSPTDFHPLLRFPGSAAAWPLACFFLCCTRLAWSMGRMMHRVRSAART